MVNRDGADHREQAARSPGSRSPVSQKLCTSTAMTPAAAPGADPEHRRYIGPQVTRDGDRKSQGGYGEWNQQEHAALCRELQVLIVGLMKKNVRSVF